MDNVDYEDRTALRDSMKNLHASANDNKFSQEYVRELQNAVSDFKHIYQMSRLSGAWARVASMKIDSDCDA